jgi:hypothetical protein
MDGFGMPIELPGGGTLLEQRTGNPASHFGEPHSDSIGEPRPQSNDYAWGITSVPARWAMDDRTARRTGYPLTIPDALLDTDAMRKACATRNFGEIFRLVNRRTGSSHADIAAAIGKMTSSRVSDIIRVSEEFVDKK